jgi:hypothetical protein
MWQDKLESRRSTVKMPPAETGCKGEPTEAQKIEKCKLQIEKCKFEERTRANSHAFSSI